MTIINIDTIKSFINLSLDDNPIHFDFNYSYNSPFGSPIIHGILLFLHGINGLSNKHVEFSFVKCKFLDYINIDEQFEIIYENAGKFTINKNNTVCVECIYQLKECVSLERVKNNIQHIIPTKSKIELFVNNEILNQLFPNIYNYFNNYQIFQIINLSRFVGKISPGLNSIFTSFEITYTSNSDNNLFLNFINKIDNSDKVVYDFISNNLVGTLEAYYRPKPIIQKNISDDIDNSQFSNCNICIIGGSRGIGEIIAKIYNKGGAEVTITYNKSEKEAKNIQNETNNKIKIININIELDLNKFENHTFTHLFYMVTPSIKNTNTFDLDLYEKYYYYYVKKFEEYVNYFCKNNNTLKYIFYPSSISIGQNIYKEYNICKEIGEKLINLKLSKKYNNIKFDIHRFPRLLTNQTNTLINVSQDPYEYLKNILKIKINKKIDTYILCNSNIDFIYRNIQNSEFTPYGQLFQILINNNINCKNVIILNTVEDILQEQYIFQYKKEYDDRFDNYFMLLKNFLLNKDIIIAIELFQRLKSPFDETSQNIKNMISRFNNKLKTIPNIHIIDIYSFDNNKFSLNTFIDSKSPFSLDFSNFILSQIYSILYYNNGETIKCIITDLDNTLWKGVISEDKHIKINEEYQLFQKILKLYKEKGIILCICSKNDISIVKEVLAYENNILNENDFVYIEANWFKKSDNIINICQKLNINIKHVLFIDDSPIEREEVRMNCPNIKILNISNPDPIEYINLLMNNPYLYNPFISESNQTELYKIKDNIDLIRKKVSNLDTFYMTLETKIFFDTINDKSFDRAFQLMLKTNQFNLNKISFSEREFKDYLKENMGIIISYSDKFVKFDQIGLILLSLKNNEALIDNIILSCRVFNRDFETSIFTYLKNWAFNNKYKLIGKINKTEKNKLFHNLYQKYDFDINNSFIPNDVINYPKWFTINDNTITMSKIENTSKIENIKLEIINIIKELDSDVTNDIKSFNDIKNFNSLGMMYLLEKINNKFKKNIRLLIFYDKDYNLIDIPSFIEKIMNILH